jgi:tetratricopeptide (TPR) repeat protein
MVSRSTFTSKLVRDPRQRAEIYSREGNKRKAAETYAQLGDYRQAARLAIEAGEERLAVDCSLKAAFGPGGIPAVAAPAASGQPAGSSSTPPAAAPGQLPAYQAAELLEAHGHHDAAIGLFELTRAYRRAAASALALGQSARAARLFERGRTFFDAAVQYENAELLDDALRVLELEGKRLGREERGRLDGTAGEQLARVELRRAEVLRKLGRDVEAAVLLRDLRPTGQSVRLLAESGRYREAIEAALQMGDAETAVRLLHRAPDIDRRLAAEFHLRAGHAVEAGNLYAALGMAREAADAYEKGGDWAKAGSRWEAAREYEHAAEAYSRARRPRDAGRCYAALDKHQLAASSFSVAGDHAAAAEQYLKARQRVAAAAELLDAGDQAEATRVLMQVADTSPEREAATLKLVPLLLEDGRAEEALRRLHQLPPLRLNVLASTTGRALPARDRLYWMARAYEQLGRLGEAESSYRELADPKILHLDADRRLVAVREQLRAGGTGGVAAGAGGILGGTTGLAATGTLGGLGRHSGATAAPFQPPSPFPMPALEIPPFQPQTNAPASAASAQGAAPPARGESRDVLTTHATTAFPAAAGWSGPGTGAAGHSGVARATVNAPLPPGTLAIGQLLAGRFQILAELGQGGMGRVYKARDLELHEPVAIKVLSGQPDDGSVEAERLIREVQICRKITHPNVVRVFDLGRHAGSLFIIMELLEGEVLVDLIDPERRPSLARLKTILCEIASGLGEAHALGVVHRDLKPENIILTATRLKILDFGIARMSGFDKRLTQVGFALGSPLYMAPEQIQGLPLDNRSDLYSLGVLAFALIAGHEPFDGPNSTAIAIQHLQQPPPDLNSLRPGLPAGWNEVAAKLLAKRPEDRFQSTNDVIAALLPLDVE